MSEPSQQKTNEKFLLDHEVYEYKDFTSKFNVGDKVKISRVKGLFEKGYLPNWSEQVYKVINVQCTTPTTYIFSDLRDEIIKGSFYEQELQKTDQEVFRVEKVLRKMKIKGKQYGLVKWLGYRDEFNEWLPLSEIVNIKK